MSRFDVKYHIYYSKEEAQKIAEWICLEQSVELPSEVLSPAIADTIVGKIESSQEVGNDAFAVTISYPIDNIGGEITQFLNIVFGNCSLVGGIEVVAVNWNSLQHIFPGPQYGIEGVREALGVYNRPISCTALKPMGSKVSTLGRICFDFALGGLDIIKDDHGLANQPYADFRERVKACVLATKRAFEETGHQAWYFPNITGDGETTLDRYKEAFDLGAHGVLISPHLTGLAVLTQIRKHATPLPIMAHPAFSGTMLAPNTGKTHRFLYGELWRALGADFSIYPNYGGRFPFTYEECFDINDGCRDQSLPFKTSFPTPGGGIDAGSISEWKSKYGNDTVFLIGGSLYKNPNGVKAAAKEFSTSLKS